MTVWNEFEDLLDTKTGETALHTGEGKTDFQATDLESKKDPVSEISELGGGPLKYRSGNSAKLDWEKVNEITWKLTDGEMTNVPRSHGQWGGYRTSKAVAWVIDVSATDKAAWIARYKDQCSNPMLLKQAKAAALAMAKGSAGDYEISHPIAHLNGIAARLLDSEAA